MTACWVSKAERVEAEEESLGVLYFGPFKWVLYGPFLRNLFTNDFGSKIPGIQKSLLVKGKID